MINSIAIISDAFNNLSDIGSSLVAIVGAKLSNRNPDREHPFGHGRFEYIASLMVSFIIMMMGVELLKAAFDKILHPQQLEFNLVLIIILSLSILIKVWMYSYNRYIGRIIHSGVQMATAKDSLSDVLATSAVIIATIAGRFVTLPVDGVMGLVVAGMVIYTGFDIAKDTISTLLGTPPTRELVIQISDIVLKDDCIVGLHDLIVHDYGPGRVMASVHVEVLDNVDIVKTHEIIDQIELQIQRELGIHMVIHMDPLSVSDEKIEQAKALAVAAAKRANLQFCIHDFRMVDGDNQINLIFDLVVPPELNDKQRKQAVELISKDIAQKDKRYCAVIAVDTAY